VAYLDSGCKGTKKSENRSVKIKKNAVTSPFFCFLWHFGLVTAFFVTCKKVDGFYS